MRLPSLSLTQRQHEEHVYTEQGHQVRTERTVTHFAPFPMGHTVLRGSVTALASQLIATVTALYTQQSSAIDRTAASRLTEA